MGSVHPWIDIWKWEGRSPCLFVQFGSESRGGRNSVDARLITKALCSTINSPFIIGSSRQFAVCFFLHLMAADMLCNGHVMCAAVS